MSCDNPDLAELRRIQIVCTEAILKALALVASTNTFNGARAAQQIEELIAKLPAP